MIRAQAAKSSKIILAVENFSYYTLYNNHRQEKITLHAACIGILDVTKHTGNYLKMT